MDSTHSIRGLLKAAPLCICSICGERMGPSGRSVWFHWRFHLRFHGVTPPDNDRFVRALEILDLV